jgi:hypothetical protein
MFIHTHTHTHTHTYVYICVYQAAIGNVLPSIDWGLNNVKTHPVNYELGTILLLASSCEVEWMPMGKWQPTEALCPAARREKKEGESFMDAEKD